MRLILTLLLLAMPALISPVMAAPYDVVEKDIATLQADMVARRRGHYPGQDQSERMGQYPQYPFDQWLVGDRRADPQSLCPRSQHLRLQRGQRRRDRRQPCGSRPGHRNQRLAGLSRLVQRY